MIDLFVYKRAYENDIFESYKKINGLELTSQQELDAIYNLTGKLEENLFGYSQSFSGFFINTLITDGIRVEFDLLRFSPSSILNIELKSRSIDQSKIENQLLRNRFYLNCVNGDRKVLSYTFVSETNELFKLQENRLVRSSIEDLVSNIDNEYSNINLAEELDMNDLIISPYSNIQNFLNTSYFLLDSQRQVVDEILREPQRKVMIKGGPGTGKSLILFDLAQKLSKQGKRVLLVFCSKMDEKASIDASVSFDFIDIISFNKIDNLNNYEYILIDEAQRLLKNQIDRMLSAGSNLIWSCDKRQVLKPEEAFLDIEWTYGSQFRIFDLNERLRTNEELNTFIKKFFNKSESGLQPINFPHVNVVYFENIKEAKDYINLQKTRMGYKVIELPQYKTRMSGSIKNKKIQINSEDGFTTIGREYDKVLIPMDERINYSANNILEITIHGYYPYIPLNNMFQAITRVRRELQIVVIQNSKLFTDLQEILTWKQDKKRKLISKRMNQLRNFTGDTNESIAGKIKVRTETYIAMETNGEFPNGKILQRLSANYNVPTNYLLGEPLQLNFSDFDVLYANRTRDMAPESIEKLNSYLVEAMDKFDENA